MKMNTHKEDSAQLDIRQITAMQLAQLGIAHIAYVRPLMMEGAAAFAICAADGTQMAIATDRDVAEAAIREHEMVPVAVH
jgi:hypothetical protein